MDLIVTVSHSIKYIGFCLRLLFCMLVAIVSRIPPRIECHLYWTSFRLKFLVLVVCTPISPVSAVVYPAVELMLRSLSIHLGGWEVKIFCLR